MRVEKNLSKTQKGVRNVGYIVPIADKSVVYPGATLNVIAPAVAVGIDGVATSGVTLSRRDSRRATRRHRLP